MSTIAIREGLLYSAMQAIIDVRSDVTTIQEVPAGLVHSLIEYLGEDLGCDHEVNICMCDVKGIVHELEMARDGRETCPACHGDLFVFSKEDQDAELARIAEERNLLPSMAKRWANAYGAADGMVSCTVCDGTGSVSLVDRGSANANA